MTKNSSKSSFGITLTAAIVLTLLAVFGIVLIIIGISAEEFAVLPFIIGIILFICFGFASVPTWLGVKASIETKKRNNDSDSVIKDEEI